MRELIAASLLLVGCTYRVKGVDVGGRAFGDQFYLAGRKVANVSRYWKTLGELLGGVSKTDALDPARIVYPFARVHGTVAAMRMVKLRRGRLQGSPR